MLLKRLLKLCSDQQVAQIYKMETDKSCRGRQGREIPPCYVQVCFLPLCFKNLANIGDVVSAQSLFLQILD